jgi:SPP1 family predicted phage head-tail adaptor
MTIKAGDLRESVTIQAPVEQTNAYGESTITWSDFATRRASIDGMKIDEMIAAQEQQTVGTHQVRFRYVPGLKNSMRLVWTSRSPSRTLDILAVTERNNREEHQLVCKERFA